MGVTSKTNKMISYKFLVLSLVVVLAAAGGKQHHSGKGKRHGGKGHGKHHGAHAMGHKGKQECGCKKAKTYKECEPLIAEGKCIFIKGKEFAHCKKKRKQHGDKKEHRFGGKGHGVQDWCYSQAGSDEAKCKPLVDQQKCQWFLYQEEGKEGKEGKCILAETVVDKEASMSMSADDEIYFDTQMSKNTPPPPPPPRHHGPPPPPCDDDSRPTCSDGSPPHHGPQACSDGSPPMCADGTVARPPPHHRRHGHCKFMMVLMGVAIYCLGLFTSCLKQRCCPNRCNCCKKRPVNASSVVVPAVVIVATIADPALAKEQPITPIVIQEE